MTSQYQQKRYPGSMDIPQSILYLCSCMLCLETTGYETFVGMPAVVSSPAIRELLQSVQRVARSTASVLISGETGSGKEVIARAVHHYSLRCSKPWVDVNCAALPEHLVESELFGYEKGAFSGATGSKPGLFEMAHTGTLFLDEIGDLDTRMQVKLLRVLDGMPYYRLGGTRKVTVDVRILAATNLDLDEAVHAGRFRRDLYYRLGQVTLEVPPLRQRREDIVPLASFFLRQFDSGFRLSEEACRALVAHSWPGNVRELRNVVVKAALCSDGGVVESYALEVDGSAQPASEEPTERWNLDGVERRLINEALAKTQGHQQEAASLLGISRRTLSRKLKLYGMQDSCQTCLAS